jgi:NAD(P)-dependent dehydrogenase (short-subunit alcohol dehydrogenase family)
MSEESADRLSLCGRVALVTGAAQGLGRSEAMALAARGASVVAVDVLDATPTVAAIRDTGGRAFAVQADISRPEAAEEALRASLDTYQDLHILVNNAGIVRDRMSFNLGNEEWQSVLAVNLSGTFLLARAAARLWRARAAEGDRQPRAVVNTSSESGLYGNPGQANYAAAKAGVAALTLTLAAELDRYGIRVNAIAPRARTPMSLAAFGALSQSVEFDRFAPEHVAGFVAWLCSGAAADVTGQVFVVDGSGVAVMEPWSVVRFVERHTAWTDDALDRLREQLFPDELGRRLIEPVGRLFGVTP